MSEQSTGESTAPSNGEALYWRVLSYLKGNEGEELTRADVAIKFGVDHASVDTLLRPAVLARKLMLADNDENGTVFRLPLPKGHFPRTATPSLTSAMKEVRRQRRARNQIDFSAIRIEKGIPVPEPELRINVWKPIFSQMEVGDSFSLPIEGRVALAHAQQVYRKLQPSVNFAIRRISETQVRIWRLT